MAHRTPRHSEMLVDGILIEVVRKDVKGTRISVRGPEGHVRVSAPYKLADDSLRRTLESHLGWIRQKQERFRQRAAVPCPEFTTGEVHPLQGTPYRLEVIEAAGRGSVQACHERMVICMRVRPGAPRDERAAHLDRWYRDELRERARRLVADWEPKLGVEIAEVRIKRMRTRWGSCNIQARRIWLNLELIKKPSACLEYVVVHEMAHLHVADHGERFRKLMDGVLPPWRDVRRALNEH